MAIITITSDWGNNSHYLASVKGNILRQIPGASIIDISHDIKAFNIEEAGFILRNSFSFFPEGSIHIIGINAEESEEISHVVVKHRGHFFIGSDNGIFSIIFREDVEEVYELTIPLENNSFTFSSRDRFIKAAKHIAEGSPLHELGPKKDSILQKILIEPVTEPDLIKGHVIYVDRYENLLTNISRELFNKIGKGRRFSIVFRSNKVDVLSDSYLEKNNGELLALFNSNNYLEIAINQGNAAGLLGLKEKSLIRIEFY